MCLVTWLFLPPQICLSAGRAGLDVQGDTQGSRGLDCLHGQQKSCQFKVSTTSLIQVQSPENWVKSLIHNSKRRISFKFSVVYILSYYKPIGEGGYDQY